MSNNEWVEYEKAIGAFFFPFLKNVELGHISAQENKNLLIGAFINFYRVGYFNPPNADGDAKSGGQTTPPRGKPEAVGGTGLQAVSPFPEPMQSAPETNSGGDC